MVWVMNPFLALLTGIDRAGVILVGATTGRRLHRVLLDVVLR